MLPLSNPSIPQTVHDLFDEIDAKKNGWIDKFHFRILLRALKLTFSDDRFNRLYRALDSSGDGKIEWPELHELLFGHYDEKERATTPHHQLIDSEGLYNHRDSVSSERFSVVEANSNFALRQALLNSMSSPGGINVIAEGDEDDDDSDEDSEDEDSDSEYSQSAFSRSNSRISNHSGGNRSRTNSYTGPSKSPRNSVVKPSQMLKQSVPSSHHSSSSSSPSTYHLASPSPVSERKHVRIAPAPSNTLTEEGEKTEIEEIPLGRAHLVSIDEEEDPSVTSPILQSPVSLQQHRQHSPRSESDQSI